MHVLRMSENAEETSEERKSLDRDQFGQNERDVPSCNQQRKNVTGNDHLAVKLKIKDDQEYLCNCWTTYLIADCLLYPFLVGCIDDGLILGGSAVTVETETPRCGFLMEETKKKTWLVDGKEMKVLLLVHLPLRIILHLTFHSSLLLGRRYLGFST
ncbi:hypothetical protein RUM43_003592 [Polyplax serrata]|uniref:Uncharacterized protein n=1 Tax=Polyplax serrata TaxID=468196 RepID=A0AAN8NVN9_POLSC